METDTDRTREGLIKRLQEAEKIQQKLLHEAEVEEDEDAETRAAELIELLSLSSIYLDRLLRRRDSLKKKLEAYQDNLRRAGIPFEHW